MSSRTTHDLLQKVPGLAEVTALAIIGTIALYPYFLLAQEKTEDGLDVVYMTEEDVNAMNQAALDSVVIPEGLKSCFEYYDYGSVAIVPTLELTSTVPNATLAVQGTIQNMNQHPIVDGMVYVKVFKMRDSENIQFGDDLVDQFTALRDVTLGSSETKQFMFEWTVPENAEPGDYRIATYFISAERFNLEGLSFTDDIVGGSVAIAVQGEEKGVVRFDRELVTLNGETHEFATFMSTFDETTKDVVIKAVVSNSTSIPYKGSITWTLYGWDGLRAETMISQKSEELKVHPNDTAEVEYTSQVSGQYPVYYLVGELSNGGSKSIIDVRYVHVGTNTAWARFNDVGVNSYPLREGSAYACFQGFSGSLGIFPEGKVEVKVTTPGFFGARTVSQRSYEGVLGQDFVALPVPVSSTLNDFTVSATLYIGDQKIDEVHMQYSCELLTPGMCESQSGSQTTMITTLLALLLLGGALVYRKMQKGHTGEIVTAPTIDTTNKENPPKI